MVESWIMSRIGILTVFFLVVVEGLNSDGGALLEFKKGITLDPQSALQEWRSSDATPCLWSGVECSMEDRVVSVALPRRELTGTISPRLGDLAFLTTLSLESNNLTGAIPAALFNATALAAVYLAGNALTGAIPPEICNVASQLRVLELQGNQLTEALPPGLASCFRLRSLILSYNNFSGDIPGGLSSAMEWLDLSVNRFSGAIPADLGNLTLLKAPLNLSYNVLSGAIPSSLANLQRVPLDVSHNLLSGAIPAAAYFQSQGPPAYVGNAALCGSPLKVRCAPSPSPSPSPSSSLASDRTAIFSKASVLGIAFSCAFLLIMATVVVMRKQRHGRRTNLSSSQRGCLCSWREAVVPDGSGDLVHLSGVLSFDLEELLRASAYVLGKSAVGIVYKAVLHGGTAVAVRRLGEGGAHKQKEFVAEAKAIARVSHPNVVTLHSYSWSADEKLLVYDYLPSGSLETALHGSPDGSKRALSLEARLRIARGAAQGIAHIHECKHVHGDVKPSNILLDAFLDARVSDFGLQRLLSLLQPERVKELPASPRASSVSPAPEFPVSPAFLTGVYEAPEAARRSQKNDVYSFGVLLLELLTGRSPFKQLAAGQHNLVSWIRFALQQKEALSDLFDPALRADAVDDDDDDQRKMIETLQVALACIAENPDSRPKMRHVAEFFQQHTKRP